MKISTENKLNYFFEAFDGLAQLSLSIHGQEPHFSPSIEKRFDAGIPHLGLGCSPAHLVAHFVKCLHACRPLIIASSAATHCLLHAVIFNRVGFGDAVHFGLSCLHVCLKLQVVYEKLFHLLQIVHNGLLI